MKSLLIGTGNRGKVSELAELLGDSGFTLVGLDDLPGVEEPVEDGATFEENAAIKAKYYARHFGMMTLADDSGLEVDALDGLPGVVSARYSGPGATDEKNNLKLLEALNSIPDEDRTARFVCAMCVADKDGQMAATVRGVCEGRIGLKAYGSNGFGYDPLFIPEGYGETFGQLTNDAKSRLSHRASAARKIKGFLVRNSLEAT